MGNCFALVGTKRIEHDPTVAPPDSERVATRGGNHEGSESHAVVVGNLPDSSASANAVTRHAGDSTSQTRTPWRPGARRHTDRDANADRDAHADDDTHADTGADTGADTDAQPDAIVQLRRNANARRKRNSTPMGLP